MSEDQNLFYDELRAFRVKYPDRVLKCIVETELLTEKEIKSCIAYCRNLKIDYIKSCTGFNGKVSDGKAEILLTNRKYGLGVKLSGGIKDRERALNFIKEGADIIGSSSLLVE